MFRCRYCGRFLILKEIEIDHIIPVARGGMNYRNLACACVKCNRAKWISLWQPRPLAAWQLVFSFLMVILFDHASIVDWLVESIWYKV